MVEIGSPEKSPIILTDRHIRFMAEHLLRQCDALCNDEHYICKDGDFKMNSAGNYRAKVFLGKRSISFKLDELRYLSIFFMVHNQLIRYTEAMRDVMKCVTSALYSTTYVEPPPNANKTILYYQRFEELKSIV